MSSLSVPDAIWPTNNAEEIPLLLPTAQADALDAPFVAWGTLGRGTTRMGGTWHFYVDDYRFTALVKRPDVPVLTGCVAVVEPNFSLFDDMPYPVALFRTYQKRWLARYWQAKGLRVWVDLNVPERFSKMNLLGVPPGWAAYATRGYTRRLTQTHEEFQIAKAHAAPAAPLFLVYGGGKRVQAECQKNGWLWLAEHRSMVANGKE